MVKPRPARPTVKCVDTYCELYENLFPEVRAYEAFKYLHVGLISELKRKSLPASAKIVGKTNEQGLLHFLSESPWPAEDLEKRRLAITLNILEGREIEVIIDETGDPKKGKKTDYVKRQYIGKLGKIENGIVSVNAYGYCEGMTFPLKFKVFKPLERLKEGDNYQTKPELGAELVRELRQMGFKIKRVLADSFYGESRSNFLRVLEELEIEYAFFDPQQSWGMVIERRNELDRVILFGSQARGNATPESDIDILIVLKHPFRYYEEVQKISEFISNLSLKYNQLISCCFTTSQQWKTENSAFYRNIHKKGIIL